MRGSGDIGGTHSLLSRLCDVLVGFEQTPKIQGLSAPEVPVDGPVEGQLEGPPVEASRAPSVVAHRGRHRSAHKTCMRALMAIRSRRSRRPWRCEWWCEAAMRRRRGRQRRVGAVRLLGLARGAVTEAV
jgi:hypothetical protein